MEAVRTLGIYVAVATLELLGTYAVWRWLRLGGSATLAIIGMASLFGYAVIQTFQLEIAYGRVYAAYAGIFLIGAMLWGWLVDGRAPDRFDVLGAVIVLLGVVTILWGRRLA